MKQIIMMCAALVITFGTSAQIIHGTVGNGTYTDYSGVQQVNVAGLDFNNDGIHEFALATGYTDEGAIVENGSLNFVWTEDGTCVATVSAEQWDKIRSLNIGDLVGPATGWYAQGDASVNTDINEMYVGLRFKLDNNTYYGWARVETTATNENEYTSTWKEIYYQASNNTAIAVGDRNSTGIVAAKPSISLSVKVSGQDIIVETNSNDIVRLYDLSGRLLSTRATDGLCTLKAPSTGAYVICAGMTSIKVIVR